MATIHLTASGFKEKVFDYETQAEWNYKGEAPAIIDFYADWCGPCKMIAPMLEELSDEYKGDLVIYKVDTEAEFELAGIFGIQSIPSLLFIPMEGQPLMQAGALPKSALKEIIRKHLIKAEQDQPAFTA
ncbi:MAG TPA: thioredoxin [Panacibacter sp.]|nr:thioredoxin [Panacibacter sp.]HNP44432.1 thioredoxin [Panacibacter sp.]